MKTVAAGLVFGLAAVVTAIATAFATGGLGPGGAWLSLGVGILAAGWAGHTTREDSPVPLRFWDYVILNVFALASLRAFLWLIYVRGDDLCVLSPNNLGDLALHMNFIRYFASGIPFWPESPILTGVPLAYPLGADLFNSLLEICGMETGQGLIFVGLVGAGLTGYVLWRWGGAFTVAVFLCSGGLAGFAFLKTFAVEDFQQALYWKNLFLSMFVTQRGFLFALPAGLLLLTVWRDHFFRGERFRVPPSVQLLLYASMPLFSAHTFLFLSVILLGIFVGEKSSRRELICFVGVAFLPASLAAYLITGGFSSSAGLRWLPQGILVDGSIKDWIWNFGLMLPAGLALAVSLLRQPDREARCLAGTALGIFLVGCFVALAPWEWDNMKLLIWSLLVIAPYVWTRLILPLKIPARTAICVLLFFSGAVSLVGGLDGRHGYPLAKRSELAAWKVAIKDIPPGDRFACVPDYNHPLILLGRKVACGYEGHLWSHGLDYREKLKTLQAALNEPSLWPSAAAKLDAQWLGLRQQDIPPAQPPGTFPEGSFGALYDLGKVTSKDPTPPQIPVRTIDFLR